MAQIVKNPPAMQGNLGLIPGLGSSPGEGNGLPTPVFLPGDFHEQRSLGTTVQGLTKLDMTEKLTHTHM